MEGRWPGKRGNEDQRAATAELGKTVLGREAAGRTRQAVASWARVRLILSQVLAEVGLWAGLAASRREAFLVHQLLWEEKGLVAVENRTAVARPLLEEVGSWAGSAARSPQTPRTHQPSLGESREGGRLEEGEALQAVNQREAARRQLGAAEL